MKHRILTRFFVALGIAWFVLWACAPMSSNPPPTPMPEAAKGELGAGFNGGATVIVDEWCEAYVFPLGNVQAWGRFKAGPDKQDEAGVIAQMGLPSFVSMGGYYRKTLARTDKAYVGAQFDIGGFWLGTSLPTAYRLTDSLWLTTMPGLRASNASNIELPIGIGWQAKDTVRFDMEIGTHFLFADELYEYDYAGYCAMGASGSF